jgi:Putative zinc-finger
VRPDRDDPLAPAIRRRLQGSRTDCPDAGTIAAYAERSLADAERRDVDLHLSTCARCRETLLLMSRAAEADTPASSSPRFLLYRWPWLAGAAAAGLAIVVGLALLPSAVLTPESDRVAQVISRPDTEKPREPEQSAANKAPVASDQAQAKEPTTPPRPAAPAAPAPQDRQAFDEKKRGLDDRRTDPKLEETGERRAPVQKMPVAGPEALPPVAPPPARGAAESAAAQAPPAAAPKPDSGTRDTASPQLMSRARQNPDYLIASGPPANAQAASAIPAITWRVSPSGIVERSADGGATWTREPGVDAPAARAIRAPSRDVCWIVGDSGLILRFEAGRGWARLSPPAQIGFIAVEASDAVRATIEATDGRRFTTTDGGQTWK